MIMMVLVPVEEAVAMITRLLLNNKQVSTNEVGLTSFNEYNVVPPF